MVHLLVRIVLLEEKKKKMIIFIFSCPALQYFLGSVLSRGLSVWSLHVLHVGSLCVL